MTNEKASKRSSIWRRWLTKWLKSRLKKDSVENRTYIIQALGKVGDESALPIILDSAHSEDSTIRRFAISALADLKDARAIDALIEALNDSENDIKATAVIALGFLDDKKAEIPLIELLKDRDNSVRSQAVIALGRLRSTQALPILEQMKNTEPNEWIRRYISEAILEIKGGIYS
jgi:HEAT repeat protein